MYQRLISWQNLLLAYRKASKGKRSLTNVAAAYRQGEVPLDKVTRSVQGWVNHIRYGNTVGLRKAVLGQINLGRPTTSEFSRKVKL